MLFMSLNNNTAGGTSGAGTAYHSGTPEFLRYFSRVCGAQNLSFSSLFHFAIKLTVLRCTALHYHFRYLQTMLHGIIIIMSLIMIY